MTPLTDAMVIPGLVTAIVTAGPKALAVLLAVTAGVAFLVRGASEELRRLAARDWESRRPAGRPEVAARIAV